VTYEFPSVIQGKIVRIEGQTPRTTSDGYLSLAEVEVIAPYENVTITVTQNPVDARIFENQTATFGPVAAAAPDVPPDRFRIQWQKNDAEIPGATGATYTTSPESASDSGAQFSAKFTLPALSAVSTKAKLTVTRDVATPLVD